MGESRIKPVRLLFAAFNNGDFEGVQQQLHPEVVMIVKDENGQDTDEGPYHGIEGIQELFESIRERIIRPYFDAGVIYEDGNRVITSVTVRGTLRATGTEGSMPAVHVYTVEDGLIREIHTHRPPWERLGSGDEES